MRSWWLNCDGCDGCAFNSMDERCYDKACTAGARKDDHNVIFVPESEYARASDSSLEFNNDPRASLRKVKLIREDSKAQGPEIGWFHGFGQGVGPHAGTVAIIELESGTIRLVHPELIQFI